MDVSSCLSISTISSYRYSDDAVELKTLYVPKNHYVKLAIPSSTNVIQKEYWSDDDNTIIMGLDPYLKEALLTSTIDNRSPSPKLDRNGDGEISIGEAKLVKTLDLGSSTYIKSLSGIEYFQNLESVNIGNNQWFSNHDKKGLLSDVDLSNNKQLVSISLLGQAFETISLPHSPSLKTISIHGCSLKTIDLSGVESLDRLEISYSNLSSLDVSNNSKLDYLQVNDNQIIELTFGSHPSLEWLTISNNPIQHLDVDVSEFPMLYCLQCSNTGIVSLDVHSNTCLDILYCKSDCLETLYIFKNYYLSLSTFDCQSNTNIVIR